jgi:hypothetical protein
MADTDKIVEMKGPYAETTANPEAGERLLCMAIRTMTKLICCVWARGRNSRQVLPSLQSNPQLTNCLQRNFNLVSTLGFISIYMATWEFVLVCVCDKREGEIG